MGLTTIVVIVASILTIGSAEYVVSNNYLFNMLNLYDNVCLIIKEDNLKNVYLKKIDNFSETILRENITKDIREVVNSFFDNFRSEIPINILYHYDTKTCTKNKIIITFSNQRTKFPNYINVPLFKFYVVSPYFFNNNLHYLINKSILEAFGLSTSFKEDSILNNNQRHVNLTALDYQAFLFHYNRVRYARKYLDKQTARDWINRLINFSRFLQ